MTSPYITYTATVIFISNVFFRECSCSITAVTISTTTAENSCGLGYAKITYAGRAEKAKSIHQKFEPLISFPTPLVEQPIVRLIPGTIECTSEDGLKIEAHGELSCLRRAGLPDGVLIYIAVLGEEDLGEEHAVALRLVNHS